MILSLLFLVHDVIVLLFLKDSWSNSSSSTSCSLLVVAFWAPVTVTKMWQKMGHIASRSLCNLTKCCTSITKFIYLVRLRRLQCAMCPIFCHILVTVIAFMSPAMKIKDSAENGLQLNHTIAMTARGVLFFVCIDYYYSRFLSDFG